MAPCVRQTTLLESSANSKVSLKAGTTAPAIMAPSGRRVKTCAPFLDCKSG